MEDDLNKEYKKCLNNPLYFYENYVIIRDSEGNELPRTLTPAQEQVVKKLQEYFIENVDKPLLKEMDAPIKDYEAYEKAKANNIAYIVEDEWLVKVMSDDTRVRIKYLGPQEVKIDESQRIIKM